MATPLDTRIPPPILAVGFAAAMGFSASVLQPSPLPLLLRLACAVPVFIVAGRFGFPAVAAFNRAGTTINPVAVDRATALVTEGIYRRSRNPMYVALTALLLSLAFVLGQPWVFAGPALFALFIHAFQILPEERAMIARFGPAYATYCLQVRRWL